MKNIFKLLLEIKKKCKAQFQYTHLINNYWMLYMQSILYNIVTFIKAYLQIVSTFSYIKYKW